MENQRNLLFIALMLLGSVLYFKWVEFSTPATTQMEQLADTSPGIPAASTQVANNTAVPSDTALADSVPAPVVSQAAIPDVTQAAPTQGNRISVKTDLVEAVINTRGGVIESLKLLAEPVTIEQPENGFPLLKNTMVDKLVAQDGLVSPTPDNAPNHLLTDYSYQQSSYDLGGSDQLQIPLQWRAPNGVEFTKTLTFSRDSYVIDVDYQIANKSNQAWAGTLYAQLMSTEREKQGGGFGQLPSYTGAAVYTDEEKYQKISFKDMRNDGAFSANTQNGWVAMLQHYFVAAWIPENGGEKEIYSSNSAAAQPPLYRIGYKNRNNIEVAPGDTANIGAAVYLGSKEQKRLKQIEQEAGITGLALTVDYGFLTFIADPLFIVLSWIHTLVGNWGWSIILLTILIKIFFYPLSAASYKSMAGMKKLQPRLQTLKERYKDDRQKFQMEMMALYKKEKINPAGGCLPILIQIPVFIALYWVLLESVEMRHAPFALWWQDLSAPDPYYVLPVLMGASMWLQQKLNPAPMDDIQKKVMMIMPIALTFLFLTFPQGLVLYWVVNNVLSMAQQWYINKRHAA